MWGLLRWSSSEEPACKCKGSANAQIRSLVQADPIYYGRTNPVCHNCWNSYTLESVLCNQRSPHNEKPLYWSGSCLQQLEKACMQQKPQDPE